jgi:hypothetical protein
MLNVIASISLLFDRRVHPNPQPHVVPSSRLLFLPLLIALMGPVFAGAAAAQSTVDTARVEYRLLRQQEDWRSLRGTDRGWAALKAVPVGPGASTLLTVGGEARTYVRRWEHEQWGRLPTGDTYALQRLMLHGALSGRPVDRLRLRTFVQFKSGVVAGRDGPVFPTSRDRLGVNQGFVEGRWAFGPNRAVTLRVGRQELHYGVGRMIAVREGPNLRRGFDGALGRLRARAWRADAFVLRSSATRPGVFDNGRKSGRTLWGLHAHRDRSAGADLSAYYMGAARDAAPTDPTLRITRHTIGVRGTGAIGRVRVEGEGAVQGGRYQRIASGATGPVRAGMLAGRLTYRGAMGPGSTLGVAADWSSGDAGDTRTHETFAAPYPSGRLTGAGSRLGPGNLLNLRPIVGLPVHSNLRLQLRGHFFWRSRSSDGLYAVSGIPLRKEGHTDARFVGAMPAALLTWTATRHLTVAAEASHFLTGSALTRPGRDMTHLGLRAKYRF